MVASYDAKARADPLTSHDGTPRAQADRVILATDRVRHVGDGVAFIIAQTRELAVEAAALVDVDYDVLDAILGPADLNASVPIWPDAPDNVCFDWQFGDTGGCGRLFAQAVHVVRLTLRNPRIVVNALEPRAAIGEFDAGTGQFTLIANTQGAHFVRRVLARALGVSEQNLRVLTPNVGGGFGSKIFAYPEHAMVLCGARAVTSDRSEAFLSDTQGRDHETEAALALDENGELSRDLGEVDGQSRCLSFPI